ncbi:MAG TPA: IclR family transcriptional regulator [Acidimicrobiales bacterium]|nr:IclR family transcriptional regulator [Acidimicrobiales bacterium]
MPKMSSGEATPVRSAERMLNILGWFKLERPRGRISEIAEDLGLAPSTVRRLVTTLEQYRFLEREPASGEYRLHIEVVRLAGIAVSTNDMHQAAAPVLDKLAKELDETLILAVLDGPQVVHLAVRLSLHRLSITPPTARRVTAYEGGANGRVLLAWLPPDEVDALIPPARSWRTQTADHEITRKHFFELLETTRTSGHSINDGVSDPDLWAVAAPVRDHTGKVQAALSLLARRSSMTDERAETFIARVLEGADAISRSVLYDKRSAD